MPRGNVSQHEHLRPEITERYLSGEPSADLVAEYSQIPKRTVYRWLKEAKDLNGKVLAQKHFDKAVSEQQCQSNSSANLFLLPLSSTAEDSLPDFQYLKRKLRRIINTDGDDLSRNDNIRVNAINTYLKLVLAELGNRQALEDDEEDENASEDEDFNKLSDEELAERYHKKIKNA